MQENQQNSNLDNSNRSLKIERTLNAPVQLVWKTWTEAEHIARWWGPEGFTNTIQQMDVRPGGVWELVMHGPDSTDYKNKSIYTDIIEHELIEFDHVSAPKFHTTVRFTAEGNKTHILWHMLFESAEQLENVVKVFKADEGLKQNVTKLEKYLGNMTNKNKLTINRIFDAPLSLVWQAWTTPEHMMRWWGPKAFTVPACRMDFRVGGKYLLCMTAPDGKDYWTTGEYLEIEPMNRIVHTDSFADADGNVVSGAHYGLGDDFPLKLKVTLLFSEQDGKTNFTLIHEGIPAGEISDMTASSWNESFDKLAAGLV